MEVWNDEAPNAHTTVDDYSDDSYWNTPAEEDTSSGEVTGGTDFPDEGAASAPEVPKPDEFGDVYASDGTYIGNVYLNPEMNAPAAGLADSVHVDQTTGDLVDENGNVIGSAYDNGTVLEMGGNQNQISGPDLIVDDQGDIYDKDGNYIGNAADQFIDEYGNVFDGKGNFVGTTIPANANLGSSASVAQNPRTPGAIVPRGGSGGGGGGPGGSGGGSGGGAGGGSGLSLQPKPAQSSPSTPAATGSKVLVQQIKSGTSLIKVYSDGSREVIANYYASPVIPPGTPPPTPRIGGSGPMMGGNRNPLPPSPTTTINRSGLTPSITGTATSERDFLAALFGNINKGLNGPGSGSVSQKGYNPSTQLTPSGKPRVSGGAAAGSTAPRSTVNTMVAGSRPGQQGRTDLSQPADVMGGQLSTGAGGIAALAIGAVALFAVAS